MRNRAMLSRAAGCAAGVLSAASAQAAVYVSYSSSNQFTWRVTNMTDFDQRRSAATGRPGLPNNGSMYCAPTATLNIAAYVARHGYPSFPPGAQNWQSSTTSIYNAATNNISVLGTFMGTDPVGGTTGGWDDGSILWFEILGGGAFDVVYRRAGALHDVTVRRMGLRGVDGALVAFAYGRYTFSPGNVLTSRTGGHVVTLNRVDINGSNQQIKYRDPANDSANSTQSSFVNTVMPIQTVPVVRLGAPMLLSEMMTGANDGLRRFIDEYIAVFPRFGLSQSQSADGPGLKKIVPTPLRPAVGPQEEFFPLPQGLGPILDVESAADGSVHYLLTGPGASLPAGLYALDAIDETVEEVAALAAPKRMAMGRFDDLYVLDGTQVRRYNARVFPPTLVTSVGVGAGNISDAIDYNDATDQVWVLSNVNRRVLRFPRNLSGSPTIDTLPTALPFLVGQPLMKVHPDDGSFLIAGDGAARVTRIVRSPAANILVVDSSFDAPFNPDGLHIGQGGEALVFGDGSVREFRLAADDGGDGVAAWRPVASIWDSVAVGTSLHVSRSRTDDDGTQVGPAYRNLVESEIVGGTIETVCQGDVNDDRTVNFLDLSLILANFTRSDPWLEGDLNGDDTIDFRDLAILLSFFGSNCP